LLIVVTALKHIAENIVWFLWKQTFGRACRL